MKIHKLVNFKLLTTNLKRIPNFFHRISRKYDGLRHSITGPNGLKCIHTKYNDKNEQITRNIRFNDFVSMRVKDRDRQTYKCV